MWLDVDDSVNGFIQLISMGFGMMLWEVEEEDEEEQHEDEQWSSCYVQTVVVLWAHCEVTRCHIIVQSNI